MDFAFIDQHGYPTSGGAHPTSLPTGAIPVGNLRDMPGLRWLDGRWHVRPVLPAPGMDGNDLWFDGLPDDAVIALSDAITGAPIKVPLPWAGVAQVTLPPGTYQLVITAPNPWLDYETQFDVGAGSPVRVAEAMTRAKLAARARINTASGQARLALVTDIPGQTAIYQAKEAEARAFLAAGGDVATPETYPLLIAEIGITAPTAYQLAQVWVGMAHLFRQAAAASERARLTAIAAVDAAQDEDALEAAQDMTRTSANTPTETPT